jgi:RhoGEF domain
LTFASLLSSTSSSASKLADVPRNAKQETERLPQSRKLELNGYLTKPTTRLARYPLLLEVVIKQTPDGHPDKTTLPKVVKMVREFLAKVNYETGRTENRFDLAQLDQQLVFKPHERVVRFRVFLLRAPIYVSGRLRLPMHDGF